MNKGNEVSSLLPDGTIATDDVLKDLFRNQGIELAKPEQTAPFGNEPCICGSGIRYDLCCSENKQRVI